LDFEHREGILDVVGHAVELVERDDGLHGTFSAVGAPGDQALELIRAGVLSGMSVRALVMGPGRRDGDVVVRTACHLDRVALCRQPAYAGAVVEALRSRGDERLMMPPKLAALRPVRDVALDDALRDLGIA
jgi:HK97 family phage prohead protease